MNLQTRFDDLQQRATEVYMRTVHEMAPRHLAGEFANLGAFRKAYALEFNKPENADVRAICFSMLDGKDAAVVIWKQVRELTQNGHPLMDAHSI